MKWVCFAAFASFITAIGQARVDRVEILSRSDVLGDFGDAGAYEKLIGKVHFAVKPDTPANRLVVDLDKAPRNGAGEVEFAADVYILRPKDAARSSGAALIEIPNRGGKSMLRVIQNGKSSVDPTTPEEFGDGFLMRRGATLVWVGWQWDVRDEPGLMRVYSPVAKENPAITGLVRSDFVTKDKMTEYPLGHVIQGKVGGTEYACSDPKDPANVLTVRDEPMARRQTIPRTEWEFVPASSAWKVGPGLRAIRLNHGFEPGKIYEVIYRARDPVVVGIGLAAVRDFASYLKADGNELIPVKRVYAMGISQSGRFLRHFLFEGFNADESGKIAIDGMFIHVAGAGIGSFNYRFAQPSRDAQPTTALFYPTDLFPFADAPQTDQETGQTAGLLDRAKAANVLPKIFYTNTSYEYWSRAASLIHTSPDGKRDLPLLNNVRLYFLAGLQHYSGAFPPQRDSDGLLLGQNLPNPNPVLYFWRALFVAMDDWVAKSKAPPASRYPKLSDKTLVTRDELNFPNIPHVTLPQRVHQPFHLDFGPEWKTRIIVKQPPGVGSPFPVFVPQVDENGNEIGGVRLPQLEVPLATYTGWNLRDPKTGMPDQRVSFIGSELPFPKTKAEGVGDPRHPIAERYCSRDEYLKKFADSASKLANDGFILKEDVGALVRRGGEEWDWLAKDR